MVLSEPGFEGWEGFKDGGGEGGRVAPTHGGNVRRTKGARSEVTLLDSRVRGNDVRRSARESRGERE